MYIYSMYKSFLYNYPWFLLVFDITAQVFLVTLFFSFFFFIRANRYTADNIAATMYRLSIEKTIWNSVEVPFRKIKRNQRGWNSQPSPVSIVSDWLFSNDRKEITCIYVYIYVHVNRVCTRGVDALMIFARAELMTNILTLRSSCQVRWLQPVAQSWKFHYRHT